MEILFERSFARDLRAIRNKKLRGRIAQVIEDVKNASDFTDLKQVVKLKGSSSYYRIRVGDYRIGIELAGDKVVFVRILHRKDIYRFFP